MKICLVQYSPEWENIDLNIEKVKTLFSNFNEKVDLIIFPELTLTGFTMNSSKFAEEIDGRCTQFFIGLSKRLKTNIIAGLVESDDGSIFNSAVHFDNGIIMARYRKIHPFSMAGENNFYSASRETIVTKINNDPDKTLQKQFISGQSSEFELINLDLDGFYYISFPE